MAIQAEIELIDREKNQPMHQWVYTVLKMNIIELHLEPGRLLSETEVSDVLGISRTPVREAFIRLAEDGLIDVLPQKGSLISLIDLTQALEARFVRNAVERSVLLEACSVFSAPQLDAMEENVAKQIECFHAKKFDHLLILDNDFHELLYAGCGKERIWSYIKKLDFNYDRLRIMTLAHSSQKIIEEHREIIHLIRFHDAGRIKDLLDRHLTWDVIGEVVDDYPEHFFKQNFSNQTGRHAGKEVVG